MFSAVFVRGILWLANNNYPPFTGSTYVHFQTNEKYVALTFDDGPCPPYTDSILNILNRHKVKATFFLVGNRIQNFPHYIQKIASQNHEIGNHSWSHSPLIFKTPSSIKKEIVRTDSIIKSLGYNRDILFRAPYGKKLIELPYVLSKLNKPHILFDVVPMDWEPLSLPIMYRRVIDATRPGSIILLHDGGGDRSTTVKLTDSIIIALKKDGYSFLTASEFIRLTTRNKY